MHDAIVPLIDRKNGFRTYHFGDDVASIPNLEPLNIPHPADVTLFKRQAGKENLKMGAGQLGMIRYGFYKGKLYEVVLVADRANAPQLLAAATILYGPGQQPDKNEPDYTWQGAEVSGMYQRIPGSGIATLSLLSKPLAADLSKAVGTDASKDL